MSTVAQTSAKVTTSIFTGLACLTALYALYKWAYFALVWQTSWAMAEAMTWSVITMVLVLPVLAIEYVQNRGA